MDLSGTMTEEVSIIFLIGAEGLSFDTGLSGDAEALEDIAEKAQPKTIAAAWGVHKSALKCASYEPRITCFSKSVTLMRNFFRSLVK